MRRVLGMLLDHCFDLLPALLLLALAAGPTHELIIEPAAAVFSR